MAMDVETEHDDDDWGDFDSNMEDDDYDPSTVDHNSSTTEQIITSQLAKSKNLYLIHSQNDIKNKTNEIVQQVSTYLDLPSWSSTLLLRHFKWNKDKLIEQFFAFDTLDLLHQSGVLTSKARAPPKYTHGFECPMCLNMVQVSNAFQIGCSHQICNECWTDYICTSIKTGKECINLTCPYFKCNIIVPPPCIIKFIPQNMRDLQYRYQRFTLENYIENHLFLSFCPAPNCHYIIEIDPGVVIDIECVCGAFSCSKCKLLHSHRPCPCKVANAWVLKNSSDQENAKWILAKTKSCPKCKVPIEKNHGCNHMTCTKCKHEFCWLCKNRWASHGTANGGYYQCNIYQQQKDSQYGAIYEEEKLQQMAQNELDRYSFYLKRFDNHIQSGKMALDEMNNSTINAYENALKIIVECRNDLAWSYAIYYYLPNQYPKLALFQDCQQQLEKYTEHLHGLVEKRNDSKIANINNFMRVTKKFRD
eukprot:30378_1